jgi:SAM-dependent methyltransferase
MNCPLCHAAPAPVAGAYGRRLFLCPECSLLAVDPADHLSPAVEQARYRLHRNSAQDQGYVAFLRRLLDPMEAWLRPEMRGLDHGCGPEPVLACLARADGFRCDAYDPYFVQELLGGDVPPGQGGSAAAELYDFVLCSEVFEHFRRPDREIERILRLLRPGGLLGIMTEQWTAVEALGGWHYLSDPTHVAFYHEKTFAWLARRHGWAELFTDGARVGIYRVA